MALPSGTITFLFSDIEGSTTRWESHREAMQRALVLHNELLRAAIAAHHGHVFKTMGDEFCVAFSHPADAIGAAVDAQRSLDAHDWSAVDGLRVRMGIHSGVAEERDGDYFGPAVNRVARLMTAAHGGQVLVSHVTAQLASHDLPPGASLRDLGAHRLKDLPHPEIVFQVTAQGLRSDFSALRSVELNPTNVPLQLTPLLGREEEIAEIERRLREARLVTLTGSGGIGKTRAALEVAGRLLPEYPDGAWIVDLASLVDPALVPSAIATVFGVAASGSRPLIDEITSALKRKHALILLDNCEHVIAQAAAVAEHLLLHCDGIRILATSREALGIAGERPYRMPSLAESVAVELFAARARLVQERFELTEATRPVVTDIVRRLDGIALAIELAASRVKILSVDRIARGLDDRFKLLTGGSRTALPRQQTLRALIGWSYDLLADAERSVLCQLSVFRGGWTLEAAAAVCSAGGSEDWDVFSLVESLLEKSLVVADVNEPERYRMLESTREYALERLRQSGEQDAVAARHCNFFAEASSQHCGAYWSMNLADWNAHLFPDFDNYRAALDWALANEHDVAVGARIVANIGHAQLPEIDELFALAAKHAQELDARTRGSLLVWKAHNGMDRGEPSLDFAAEAAAIFTALADNTNLAEAYVLMGNALYRDGNVREACEYGEKALDAARATKCSRLISCVYEQLGLWVALAGEPERGRELHRQAVDLLRAAGDDRRLSSQLHNLAEALFASGDFEGALAMARESLGLIHADVNTYVGILRRLNIAAYLLARGDTAEAYPHAVASLDMAIDRNNWLMRAIAIGHLAHIAAIGGDVERAGRLIGFVNAEYARLHTEREVTEEVAYEAAMDVLHAVLPPERVKTLLDEGARTSETDAVREAMQIELPTVSAAEAM